ncbi:MAG: MBL fold metallo-hydrolase [Vicinamibacterales bacterium]
MRVRFWGVRGSVPWATPESSETGTNTPCVLLIDRDRRLVLDGGTGLVGVGQSLTNREEPVTVLLSHYHWDHVQGLPFFSPCFQPGWSTTVVGPAFDRVRPDWLSGLFASPHFPLTFADLASKPSLSFVDPAAFSAGGFEVSAARLMHPGGALAYRIHTPSGDLVYATDHEFGDPATDAALRRFATGAAAIILDAHYTPDELPRMGGRGHSSWLQCAEFAAEAEVRQLWLFHHKPGRTDDDLRAIEREAQRVFPATRLAVEGLGFTV